MTAQFSSVISRLTKTENGKRNFLKFLEWNVPTLDSISDQLPSPDSWSTEAIKEGDQSVEIKVPGYTDAILDFVQTAIYRSALGTARSRDSSGNDVPIDWTSLLESVGGSTYMAQKKVWKEGYFEYLQGMEYSHNKVRTYMDYIEPKIIMALAENKKEAVVTMLNAYEESMDEAGRAAVSSVLNSFANALGVEAEEEEF